MTLNIVVPIGSIRFILMDGREPKKPLSSVGEVTLSRSNYLRLTVPPGIWVAFQGISKEESVLLNVADIRHDPNESESADLHDPRFAGIDLIR